MARGEKREVWAAGCESILLLEVQRRAAARRTGETRHMTRGRPTEKKESSFGGIHTFFFLGIHFQLFFFFNC